MKGRKWSPEEDSYLINFGSNFTTAELGKTLKVTRRQAEHRCEVLGVSPKKIRKHKNLTDSEIKICLEKTSKEAAELLDVHEATVRRIKRRMRGTVLFNGRSPIPQQLKEKPLKPRIWTPEDDAILLKRISNNPVERTAELFNVSEDEIKNRLAKVTQEKQVVPGINEILRNFPDLLPGQIQMVKSLYSHSPKSAVEYCKNIHNFRAKILDKIV
jgi:hypothetical protein